MGVPVHESGRWRNEGVDTLLGEKDRVAGGFGELFDSGSDVDGVTDESELELASAADGSRDHHTSVDADADPKRAAESLENKAVNQYCGAHRRVGMIGEIVRRAEDGQCAVPEELVDMSARVDDSWHHDLKQRVEPGNGVLSGVRLGERREIADIDEHYRHLTALTGEHIVPLLEEPRRQDWVDIGPESGLKSLPFSQTRLPTVERRRHPPQVIVLDHWQPLAEVAGRNALGSCGKLAERSKPGGQCDTDGHRHSEHNRHNATDHEEEQGFSTEPSEGSRQHRSVNAKYERDSEHGSAQPRGERRVRARQGVPDCRVFGNRGPSGSHPALLEAVYGDHLDRSSYGCTQDAVLDQPRPACPGDYADNDRLQSDRDSRGQQR